MRSCLIMKMEERYVLSLFVRAEEEDKIKTLFDAKSWFLYRCKDVNIVCQNCGCDKFEVPDVNEWFFGNERNAEPTDFIDESVKGETKSQYLGTLAEECDNINTQEDCQNNPAIVDSRSDSLTDQIQLSANQVDNKLVDQQVSSEYHNTEALDNLITDMIQCNKSHGFRESTQINCEQDLGTITHNSESCDTVDRKLSDSDTKNDVEGNSKQDGYHCDSCNVTFKLLGPFNKHKKDGQCVFTCEYCGKVFTSRYYYNYKVHLKYHRNERSYSCDICGKTYIEKNSLNVHKRRHTNDRPYVCDICGKAFFSSSHLIYHKKSIHTVTHEIHQCDICGAQLSTSGNLKVHKQTVHKEERPYTCQICGRAFKTRKALEEKHVRVHMDVFPYNCSFPGCNKSFKTTANLNCHLKRHKNERSHFCEKCGKGFYSKKDLKLHDRVHSGIKPYSCKFCDYSCTLSGNLRKHLKTHELNLY